MSQLPEADDRRVLVIGLGDSRRMDAGVGPAVARALAEQNLPEGVEVMEARGALAAATEMALCAAVVLIVAADMGVTAGEARICTPQELEADLVDTAPAGHGLGLGDALELARLSGALPDVRIIAVQPADTSPGMRLSPAVAAALPRVIEETRATLLDLLTGLAEEEDGYDRDE